MVLFFRLYTYIYIYICGYNHNSITVIAPTARSKNVSAGAVDSTGFGRRGVFVFGDVWRYRYALHGIFVPLYFLGAYLQRLVDHDG